MDSALLRAISRAKGWSQELASGSVRSFADVAWCKGIGKCYLRRLSRLAFLGTAIVESICQESQPAELNAETLLNRIDPLIEESAQLKVIVRT